MLGLNSGLMLGLNSELSSGQVSAARHLYAIHFDSRAFDKDISTSISIDKTIEDIRL